MAISILSACEVFVATVAPTPTLVTQANTGTRVMTDVKKGIVEEAIRSTGRLEADKREDLFFRAPGRIKNIAVRQGDLVKVGQVLAELELGGLESQVADAKKAFETTDLRVKSAESALSATRSAATQAWLLAENDAISRNQSLKDLQNGGNPADVGLAKAAMAKASIALIDAQRKYDSLIAAGALSDKTASSTAAQMEANRVKAAQEVEGIRARKKPSLKNAKVEASKRLTELESARDEALTAFYESEKSLEDTLNQPTASTKRDADVIFEKATLTHQEVIGGSGSTEKKQKAELDFQEATRTYNDSLLPASAAEIAKAKTAVTTARSASTKAANDLAEALGNGSRQQAIDRLALQVQGEYDDELAVAEAAELTATLAAESALLDTKDVASGLGTAELQKIRYGLNEASATLSKTKEQLRKLNSPTEDELQVAKNLALAAETKRKDAKQKVEQYESKTSSKDMDLIILRNSRDQARIKLERFQEQEFENQIIAPFDGEITFVQGKAGDQVAAYKELIGLADQGKLVVEALIAEVDQPSLSVGQPVEVVLDAFPGQTFEAKVASLPRNIVSSTGQTVKVPETKFNVNLGTAPAELGMLARLKITIEIKDNVLVVPISSVRTVNRREFVETVIDGQRRSLPVTTGIRSDLDVEIVDGLEEGMSIFAAP